MYSAAYSSSWAQGVNLEYSLPLARSYGVDEGLPSNEVYKTIEGEDGYVWLCTDRGIVQFDGNDFVTYDQNDGLPDHVVLNGRRDYQGRVWFSTYSNDLFFYHEGIHNVPFGQLVKEQGISDVEVCDFYADRYDTLHVLSTKQSGGTYYFKLYDNFEVLEVFALKDTMSSFIYKSVADSAIIGCINYQYCEHHNHQKIRLGQGLVGFSHEANNGYLSSGGHLCYNRSAYYLDQADLILNLGHNMYRTALDAQISAISHVEIAMKEEVLHIQKSGSNFLLSTTRGIQLWEPIKGVLASYWNAASVSFFRLDKDGNYWISTLNRGQYFVPKSPFKVIAYDPSNTQTFESFLIHKNLVLMGCFDNKIALFDRFSKQKDSTLHIGNDAYGINSMHWLYDDKFLVNHNQQSLIVDVTSYSIDDARLDVQADKIYTYHGDTLLSLTKENGRVTLFSVAEGLLYTSPQEGEGFENFAQRSYDLMAQPEKQQVLIASVNGVHTFKLPKRCLESVPEYAALSGVSVSDIEKRGDQLAFATLGSGVYIYQNDAYYTIDASNGLKHEIVNCVKWFGDSTLLIGTNQGLSVALIRANNDVRVVHYSRHNGLLSNMVKQIEIHKNGFAYILTDKGLVRFHRSKLKPIKNIPLVFEGIVVDGETFTNDSVVVAADHQRIFAYFKSMNFTSSNNVEYSYKIEPISQSWISTKQPKLDLSGLRPGEYNLVFAALDPINKDIISTSLPIHVSIQAPFYQSLFFIGGLIAALVLLGALVLKIAIARIRKQAETQTQLIELEQLALRSQMNPHFFYNTLNSIQSFIATNEKRKAYDYISKFARLVRNFMDQANIKSIKLTDEIESLTAYMELEQMRFSHAFEFSIEIDEEIQAELHTIQIPATMLQPIVENAIAHGLRPLESAGGIALRFKAKHEGLCIEIEDNGIGREKSLELNKLKRKEHKSYGLGNVTRRIDLLNRKYDLTISISTEDKFDSENRSLGTIVTLELPKYDYD